MAQLTFENLDAAILQAPTTKKKKAPKAKAPKKKKDKSLRARFRELLAGVDIEKLKKPWMAAKSFRNITSDEALAEWVDALLVDPSRWRQPYINQPFRCPCIAVDTETLGLDTRLITHIKKVSELTPEEVASLSDRQREMIAVGIKLLGPEAWVPLYEVKAEIAGVCLSYDGVSGVYIPINHEDGNNVSREAANKHLQRLFDVSHLIFYNAKFDREVMRTTLAIEFRDWPHFEDIQVLHYINDPKAEVSDDTFTGDSGGLKALSEKFLGMPQISLSTIGKVNAESWNEEKGKFTNRVQYVPFTWIPTEIALWYAASDAICTWLLWDLFRGEAQDLKRVHRIDGEMVDSLTWIERQRWLVDTEPHARMKAAHLRAMKVRREHLRQLANEEGWQEQTTEEGEVIEDSKFSVDSPKQLSKLLYTIKSLTVVKRSLKTNEPSCDADALVDLRKLYPTDRFLLALENYKEFVALHPEALSYDPVDHSARIYLKQCTVAGGRLAAAGGEFIKDGGFGLNPQAIKGVNKADMWMVKGRILDPDYIEPDQVEEMPIEGLDPSCFRKVDADKDFLWTVDLVAAATEVAPTPRHIDPQTEAEKYREAALEKGWVERDGAWHKVAPNIIKNHILNSVGYSICLQHSCTSCAEKHKVLIENGKLDANGILNFRKLFISAPGWTACSSDYSNIEMRVAANVSGEPKFIKEFLEGSGDFHTLTASVVFPEFNDPNTSKARKKELRSIAKIINFALLYGGTAYTVYENLKKTLPDITFEQAEKMVSDYWEGVPEFKAFCERKQKIAREQMICSTDTGRVIKFESAMHQLGIHKPLEAELQNYFQYLRIKKEMNKAIDDVDEEKAARLKATMDALWRDRDTGVRNTIDHNKFMGKIQRVSVNVPLQGLAGDIMRMAINRIRKWATLVDPLVQAVFRLHSSVHDELDYSVKNEYMPFVVPRITRHMKLRRLHAQRKWPVGTECDTEFGPSWDVEFHLTGDDGHKPSGWTDVPGMADYLPIEFPRETVEKLIRAISSGKQSARDSAWDWLQSVLHPRAFVAVFHAFWVDKDKPVTDVAVVRKQLIAALQLHEYWLIDGTPDDNDHELETLAQYEARCGLTERDRGFMPHFGYVGAVPLKGTIRPEIPILGPAPEPEPTEAAQPEEPGLQLTLEERVESIDAEQSPGECPNEGIWLGANPSPCCGGDHPGTDHDAEIDAETEPVEIGSDPEPVVENLPSAVEKESEPAPPVEKQSEAPVPPPPAPEPEDDLLMPAPKKRQVEPPSPPEPVAPAEPRMQELRAISDPEITGLIERMGFGDEVCVFLYNGHVKTWVGRGTSKLPAEFCVGDPA
jgi:DNA polymerase I-like protein with 3'-5' exonuclease and polymerase domains